MPSPAAPRRPASPGRGQVDSPGGRPRSLGRQPDFRGLRSLLDDGVLADITLLLPRGDGVPDEEVPAHRTVLAGVSDVLRAKFAGNFADAGTTAWRPEVGIAPAWHWTLRWIYGHQEPLPAALLVEVLLLADHFQIESLTAGILAYPMDDVAEEVVEHILQAWACPDALACLARRCVPLVVQCPDVWRRMWGSPPQNAALFARFIPVLCEMDRVRLLSEYMQRRRGLPLDKEDGLDDEGADDFAIDRAEEDDMAYFPDCLLNAVGWEAFPVELLEAASRDDTSGLAELVGFHLHASQATREAMRRAIAKRCQALELQLQVGHTLASPMHARKERADMYLLPLGSDLLKAPPTGTSDRLAPGLFGRLAGLGLGVEVHLSSVHSRTPRDKARLFDIQEHRTTSSTGAGGGAAGSSSAPSVVAPLVFGTGDQSGEDPPWIEIFCKECEIRPTAIGLKHGWKDTHFCRAFVVEASSSSAPPQSPPHCRGRGAGGGGHGDEGGLGAAEASLDDAHVAVECAGSNNGGPEWTVLLSRKDHPLTTNGEIFAVDAGSLGASEWVSYDRFRIRMTAPNVAGSWHLMVNWFDIFGQFRAKNSYFTGEGCRIEATL